MRKKRSVIWFVCKEKLQCMLDKSSSLSQVLIELGFDCKTGGNHRTLKRRIEEENLNLDRFNKNKKLSIQKRMNKLNINNKKSEEEVFCVNSTYKSNIGLKRRLLQDKKWDYICSECGVGNMYNGKSLSLQLDHINGINNDNRLGNLRFLCPNCHSQTETFSGKKHKLIYSCEQCGGQRKCKTTKICSKCLGLNQPKKFNPTFEELFERVCVDKIAFTKLGEEYGVSDNAVRKRCERMGINPKTRTKI